MLKDHESMFETFLKTAYQNDKKAADERALVEAMKKLPPDVLFKIANGETKLGSSYLKACSPGRCDGMEWVEQFKDTPMFADALQLEQQSIQLEQMEQQYRAQKDAERQQEPKFWEMQDRINLQKRMLGLQLASAQLQQAGTTAPTAPGPATPPPSATEAAGGAAPSPSDGKVAFAITDEGHKFDAERATMRKEQLLDQARFHQNYNAVGYIDPKTGENPTKLLNVVRFGPSDGHPIANARHQAYVAEQHAQGSNAWNPLGGVLTPLPEEQGGTSGLLSQFGKIGPKNGGSKKTASEESFARASDMGRRMAQGDYERAVTTNLASELGQDLAKVAFAITDAGHKFDVADYTAQRDMYGKRREARSEYNEAQPSLGMARTVVGLPSLAPANVAMTLGTLAGGAPAMGNPGLISGVLDTLGERHMNYAAKKHEAGENAMNPFGGYLTPTDREEKHKAKEKKALDAGALAGLGRQAAGFLGKNPGAALGAAAGAAGGLAHGLQKDEQGNRHLLRGVAEGAAGGVAGAALGHGGQHFAKAMAHRPEGLSLGQRALDAAGATGRQLKYQGEQAVSAVRDALKPGAGGGLNQPAWNPKQTPRLQAAPPGQVVQAMPASPATAPAANMRDAATVNLNRAGSPALAATQPAAAANNMPKRPAPGLPYGSRIPTSMLQGSGPTIQTPQFMQG